MPIASIPVLKIFGGLDLGQANDRSALALILRTTLLSAECDPVTRVRGEDRTFDLRFVHRWQLSTAYPSVVARTAEIYANLALQLPGVDLELAYDATGVGRPVGDLLRVASWPRSMDTGLSLVKLYGISIHGGDRSREDGGRLYVPKRDLIAALVVLFQGQKLRIASGLADQDVLVNELVNFRGRMTASGHDTYSNDGSKGGAANDDLVSAVAFAAWRSTLRLGGWQGGPIV